MRTYLIAAAAAALLAMPLPASATTAAPGVSTDISAQTVVIRSGDRHGRFESRRRMRRNCVTETTTRTGRGGRTVTVRKKVCR